MINISKISEINACYSEVPIHYFIDINKKYKLSILTGSHYNSANLGTLEIALMKNGRFAFDNDDNSIIHYIYPDLAEKMLNEMNMVLNNEDIEEIFKVYMDLASESVNFDSIIGGN